ncbi:MAG TPA: tripartite tricarboxylate transporter substrate-binding protein [Casimicrobiaceae bacterium]|nr:tripartite tricarboxylate transporter substrate-binding protein [Casimicrobiaceae bacterium]
MLRSIVRSLAVIAWLAVASSAAAQGFPNRAITIIVPFAAGGPTDTIARNMAEVLTRSMHVPVVVEDIVGAGGTIANNRLMQSAADGYTIMLGHVGTQVIAPAVQQLKVNYLTELEPVAMIASNPQILVTKKDLPASDLKSLIDFVKANPDKLNAGTGGPGTPSHISAVYFGNETKSSVTIIHYKGSGPALQDVMAGHIDMTFEQALTALPPVRAGRLRAYAVTSKTRLASAPDIPTTDEAGLPGFYMSIWHAFWVPKGTPPETIAKLNGAIRDALKDPGLSKKLADLGQEIPSPEQQTPQALRAYQKSEQDKWWPVIKAANITAQ